MLGFRLGTISGAVARTRRGISAALAARARVFAGVTAAVVAFNLVEEHPYDEFDIAFQLAAERGWMVPAYTLPPNADHITIMRVLVKETLGHSLVSALHEDMTQACATLDRKGGLHDIDRRRVKTGAGY